MKKQAWKNLYRSFRSFRRTSGTVQAIAAIRHYSAADARIIRRVAL